MVLPRRILGLLFMLEILTVGFWGAFANFLGVINSLIAELICVMLVVEFAYEKSWRKIWLKADPLVVVWAFFPPFKVPWQIQNRWIICLNITNNMDFVVSHISREENSFVNFLANIDLTVSQYTNYNCSLNFFRADFF